MGNTVHMHGTNRVVATTILLSWFCVSCFEATPVDSAQNGRGITDGATEYNEGYRLSSTQYDGVDLLIVLDNSGSMAEEQKILATQFFPIINKLTRPVQGDPGWSFPAVENMKVALVTSDMGLQYGDNGDISLSPTGVSTCDNPVGDNGSLRRSTEMNINIQNGVIECVPLADQCPDGFECSNDGYCVADSGIGTVTCPPSDADVLSTAATAPNSEIATQTACLAIQGTEGCGFEQPLEAMVRGLEVHPGFVEDNHILAVVVVSDEEDCSISNPGLFQTVEWNTPQLMNTACNITAANESNLFDPSRYHDALVAVKDGLDEALVFSAIVGVPIGGEVACEGTGAEIAASGCLNRNEMKMSAMEFQDSISGTSYTHFEPACTRKDASSGATITEARPGRRFVKTAEDFGADGMVHSICNDDWSEALLSTGEAIAAKLSHPCFPYQAPWTETANSCPNCGTVDETCDLFIEYKGQTEELYNFECPAALYVDLDEDETNAYLAKTITETDAAADRTRIYCAVPKIAAPLACDDLDEVDNLSEATGWNYCENDGRCDYNVDATPAVRNIAAGHFFAYRCLVPVE